MRSSSLIRAWAAQGPGQPLEPFSYDPGPLGADEVEIAVEHCGLCHSDLSVIDGEWGRARGHEVIGRVVALGERAQGLSLGQRVGLGWNAVSCLQCRMCLGGQQQLCRGAVATIQGHHGGFAERVRAQWLWAVPIPDALDPRSAGPLLCGGITVFSPLLTFGVLGKSNHAPKGSAWSLAGRSAWIVRPISSWRIGSSLSS